MAGQEGVTRCAASLLDVDPSLCHVLGTQATAALGRRRVLPVLALDRGLWTPPAREEVPCFAILDGMLLAGGGPGVPAVLGPGDLVDPWASGRWTVALPV